MPLNIYRCPASDHEKCSRVSQSEIKLKTVVLLAENLLFFATYHFHFHIVSCSFLVIRLENLFCPSSLSHSIDPFEV